MGLSFHETRNIRAYDVDFDNRLKISAVFNYLQDAASSHAELAGFGFEDLRKRSLAWILNSAEIEILSYPEFGDTVIVETWPKKRHRLYSIRDFLIYNSDNEIIMKVTSAWLLIDIGKKRITDHSLLPKPIAYLSKNALEEPPEKLNSEYAINRVYVRDIKYSDIDINRHTNNTKYIDIIMDAFSIETLRNRLVKSFTINFLAESFTDDAIEVYISEEDKSTFAKGTNPKTGKDVFYGKIDWKV